MNTSAPQWSVMIPTFNCGVELVQTLQSVLSQDPGPASMQIEVVDNNSDRPGVEECVRKVGRGRVGFTRNERNLGMVGNFNRCIERARGSLVHLLHCDDWVMGGFYDRMGDLLGGHDHVGMAFCRHYFFDASLGGNTAISELELEFPGVLRDYVGRLALAQRQQYAATVVRKAAYEAVGPFRSELMTCEDWEMWMRLAVRFEVAFLPQPLAVYRIHGANTSHRLREDGTEARHARAAIRAFAPLLDPASREPLVSAALLRQARWALVLARGFAGRGKLRASRCNFLESLRTSANTEIWPDVAATFLRLVFHHGRWGLRRAAAWRARGSDSR